MRIDHVLYGVRDLADGQRWFADEFGLVATPGGSHPELGTANAIIPVGPGQYIELMAVADPNVGHPLPRVLTAMLASGDRPIGLCLRPDDLDRVASRLGLAPLQMHRDTPDGRTIAWRVAGMEAALGPQRLPFFIDWGDYAAELDAQNAAGSPDGEIARVEIGGDSDVVREWMGADLPEVVTVDAQPGVAAIRIRRGDEELVLAPR
ncbi:MAG: VOC family protein [Mycobacteriales bacterium]